MMNTYSPELISGIDPSTDIDPYGDGNMAAMALKNGYVVVTAGLRSRGSQDSQGNYNHSPVTVADAKAVIRYLRHNGGIVGDTDKIFITGTSGGGACLRQSEPMGTAVIFMMNCIPSEQRE